MSVSNWVIRNKFNGLSTKSDPSKVDPSSCVSGQNVIFTNTDRISIRELGYETYPSGIAVNSSTTKVNSIHTFRKRDGTNIMIRGQGDSLECYDETTSSWAVIQSAFTPGIEFGFTDQNINTDQHSYVYLCNGHQNYSRWSGDISHLSVAVAAVSTTVKVAATDGFPSPTGTIVIAGIRKYYSSLDSRNFTLTAAAGIIASVGSSVITGLKQFSLAPKGNILLGNDNRVFVTGITSVLAAVYFSKYGDATDFVGASLVTDSTADSPGIFNLAEGGGAVVGMAFDESATYIVKRSLIYKATLTDALYSLTPLKPFDGKSQTAGGIVRPIASENGIFFITPDKKIYYLTRLPQIDYPQLVPISDPIKPTIKNLYFEKARGIVFEDQAYIACSSTLDGENDTVLVYDIRNNLWQTPVTGWNVQDWTIYNNGGGDKLFFASNNSKNVFRATEVPIDGSYDVEAIAIMGQDTFDHPAERKYIDNFFIEGYITEQTTLNISILFDDNGFTQQLSGSISGTETDFIFGSSTLNVFGSNPFGLEMFGSTTSFSEWKKFRLYLKNTLRVRPFYSLQLQFSSNGANQKWRIISYGARVGIYSQEIDRKLIKSFN